MTDETVTCRMCDGVGALDDGTGEDTMAPSECPSCGGTGRHAPYFEPERGVINDGFRKRRTRPKGWYEKAIKDGTIRAPGAPDPDEGKVRTGTVIDVPLARAGADGSEG